MSSGDAETDARVARGDRPDAIGWSKIAKALGVNWRTAMDWEKRYRLPIVNYGSYAAAYSDRLRACVMKVRAPAAA